MSEPVPGPAFEPVPTQNAQTLPGGNLPGPLTLALIGGSVAVAIFSRLGENVDVLGKLFVTSGGGLDGEALPEIVHGQVWRLVTPIFIHFGIMHLVFNMLWLKDLGGMIEKLAGPGLLLGLVLATGIGSNLGQFYASGPFFGGMSGVVYGLLGFVWMKSRFDPASGFFLAKQTVVMMIGWFFLCMTGAIGPVANYAHGIGLAIGILCGFVSAQRGVAQTRR